MKIKTLVVDDEPDVTFTLKTTLEATGLFHVDTFNEPSKALASFKPHSYDLAILDIMMPQMNGFELMCKIKKVDGSIKVCLLTALSELSEYSAYINELCPTFDRNYIIKKPIENTALLKQLKQVLSQNN